MERNWVLLEPKRTHRTFQEEESSYFREFRRLASAELRRISRDAATAHPPEMCYPSRVFLENQQKARNMSNHVCNTILEHLKKKKLVFLVHHGRFGR